MMVRFRETLPKVGRSTARRVIGYFSFTGILFASSLCSFAAATTNTAIVTSKTSPIAEYTVLTLTATVTSGGPTSLIAGSGTVNFYDDATTPTLIGTAQVVPGTGMARLTLVPGEGKHNFTAQYLGTTTYSASAVSAATTMKVASSGLYDLQQSLTATGNPTKGYRLVDQITLFGSIKPTGTLSFIDVTDGNAVLSGPQSIGKGTGTFANSIISSSPTNTYSSAVGDFSGDGYPDVVYTASPADGSHSHAIYISQVTPLSGYPGSFSFSAVQTIPAGTDPLAISVGDFNSDGNLDIAAANATDGTVTLLLGNGAGTFTNAGTTTVGAQPLALAAYDFNRDGYLDLAVADVGDQTVTILHGSASGQFGSPQTLTLGSYPFAIAAADINQDGVEDLVVANSLEGSISVIAGNSDGTFQEPVKYASGQYPVALSIADLDGDGYPDVAVSNQTSPGAVTVLEKLVSGGSFQPGSVTTHTYAAGDQALGIVSGDFSGDGILDLAVTGSGDNSITILPGVGDGTFDTTNVQTLTNSGMFNGLTTLSVADFNGDGTADLIVPNYFGGFSNLLLGARTLKVAAPGITVTTPSGNHTVQAVYQSSGSNDPYAGSTSNTQTITAP